MKHYLKDPLNQHARLSDGRARVKAYKVLGGRNCNVFLQQGEVGYLTLTFCEDSENTLCEVELSIKEAVELATMLVNAANAAVKGNPDDADKKTSS